MSGRRVLVVLRAGDTSLHPSWLRGSLNEERNWDLHLSYFGDQPLPFKDRAGDIALSFEKGTKAIGTATCIKKLGDRIWSYDWIWLPDDDLAADLTTLNRFFEIVAEYNLDLSQPALGAGSYASSDITMQRPHMKLRFTTFIEIMAPCFSRRALRLCLPYLDATISSWGPDILFPRLLGYSKDKIAIVDETPVVHTRPLAGGPNITLAKQLGADPHQELETFLRQHELSVRFDTWGGVTKNGRYTTDGTEIDCYKALPKS